jgi:2-amino-4-hydroxy-6-hydroxymethyldihydropteridine diphosphokinase
MHWRPVYVGIGSNLDDPPQQVRRAFDALAGLPSTGLWRRSSLYGSRPMGPVPQPDFVNAVAGLLTQLTPHEFLAALLALEAGFGRARLQRWGPRRIDLDLLVFAAEQMNTPGLTIPHPGIVQRNFVLYPLAEVAPTLEVPGLGRVSELAARIPDADIWRLATN